MSDAREDETQMSLLAIIDQIEMLLAEVRGRVIDSDPELAELAKKGARSL